MASKKYRFVSPGVQLRELDRSQIPDEPEAIGPVIIGRAQRGPALQPVKVQNFTEFVQIFGTPQPGGKTSDVWRDGNEGLSPQYGAYAAQAWLANSTPLTFVRLLGRSHTNASAGGEAGWLVGGNAQTTNGGAFGLFLTDDAGVATGGNITGSLAAVFYTEAGYVMSLSGTRGDGSTTTSATAAIIKNAVGPAGGNWTVELSSSSGAVSGKKFEFNFDATSGKFIRKVLNTNPTKLQANGIYETSEQENYFLGETYESVVQTKVSGGAGAGQVYGVILGLDVANGANDLSYNANQVNSNPASTGWFVAQDTGPAASFAERNLTKLFKVVALEHGTWANENIKISIQDIRYSDDPTDEYGTFSLVVRSTKDTDSAPIVLESYSNLNLNPDSPNYVAARIGTEYARWDDTSRRWRYYGEYPNASKYVRIVEAAGVGSDPTLLPFGFQGPIRPVGFTLMSGSTDTRPDTQGGTSTNASQVAFGSSSLAGYRNMGVTNYLVNAFPTMHTMSFDYPATKLRASTKTGNLSDPTDAYFGVDTTNSNLRFDTTYVDLVRGLPDAVGHPADADVLGPTTSETSNFTEFSYIFSLDEISRFSAITGGSADLFEAYYVSGSRAANRSLSATGSSGTGTYKDTIDAGFDKFTAPMNGVFDGNNILETEAFNNNIMDGKTQLNSAAFNTVRIAIDTCADPELVDMNILSAPGISVNGLTNRVIDVCQSRGDALGIIDIKTNSFTPAPDRSSVVRDDASTVRGNAADAAKSFKQRQINNSYGATYYPWTRVRDNETGKTFYCPPSVAAIGTLSYSQAVSEVWFAPAGFNRGGLTAGAAGIPVVGVTEKLSSKDRDKLYEANINPIASFPSEGLVVFGQKTLQSTRSALDRINVRRLLINVKKEISRISNGLLFDPNTQVTWDRFKGQAVPFLQSVKARLGLEDFKVVLDTTTTTPDLVDRNVMYAKIFLKPTRAIEFIAVDFVITNTGASFED